MAFVGFLAILIDIEERYQAHSLSINFGFVSEIFLEGMALPVLGGLLLSYSERSIGERNHLIKYLSLKDAFIRQINAAPQWDDLIKIIAEFPRNFLPVIGSILVMDDPVSNQMETKATWGFYAIPLLPFRSAGNLPDCPLCATSLALHGPVEISKDFGLASPIKTVRYCQPLVVANLPVAVLHLYLPAHIYLTKAQKDLLTGLAPVLALAIEAGRQKRQAMLFKESAEVERRLIARNLHDNLAQDLILLRHKLDLLTVEETLKKPVLQRELSSIREIAEEAYVDVRSTLKDIEASIPAELSTMLQDYINSLDDRASFEVLYSCSGVPQPLPARIAHQVMYIFGETLSNIEEHAKASQVKVRLDWGRNNLILSVSDNGRGFDLRTGHRNGHMGLNIMRERAEEILGKLVVKSEPGAGTEVILKLPTVAQA